MTAAVYHIERWMYADEVRETYVVWPLTVALTDAEYAALSAEAAESGKRLETLLHEVLLRHIQPSVPANRHLSRQEIQAYLYREGLIEHIPTNEPDTAAEEAERRRLAQLFGQGKLASEMLIEDRRHHR